MRYYVVIFRFRFVISSIGLPPGNQKLLCTNRIYVRPSVVGSHIFVCSHFFPWWRRYVLYETEGGGGREGASDRQKQRQTHRQRRSATLCPKFLFFVSASSLHGADFQMLRSENYPSFPRLSVVHAVHHTRFLGELNDDTAASCTRMTHWMPVLILGLMREKSNLLGGRLSTTKASGRFLK